MKREEYIFNDIIGGEALPFYILRQNKDKDYIYDLYKVDGWSEFGYPFDKDLIAQVFFRGGCIEIRGDDCEVVHFCGKTDIERYGKMLIWLNEIAVDKNR